MNAKFALTMVFSALLISAGAAAVAAERTDPSRTQDVPPHGAGAMHGAGPMHGPGPMMGMGKMAGGCPMMMGGSAGMDPKTAMRMHGEMMRAMGDIMVKYADQAASTPSK